MTAATRATAAIPATTAATRAMAATMVRLTSHTRRTHVPTPSQCQQNQGAAFVFAAPVPVSPPVFDGFESGNFSALPWQLSSSGASPADWTVQSSVVESGSFAAQSGAIGPDSSSTLSVTLTEPAGELSFWRKVSSAPNSGLLTFDIDGVPVNQWSGSVPWQESFYWHLRRNAHLFLDLLDGRRHAPGQRRRLAGRRPVLARHDAHGRRHWAATTVQLRCQRHVDRGGPQRRGPQLRRRRVHELCIQRRYPVLRVSAATRRPDRQRQRQQRTALRQRQRPTQQFHRRAMRST